MKIGSVSERNKIILAYKDVVSTHRKLMPGVVYSFLPRYKLQLLLLLLPSKLEPRETILLLDWTVATTTLCICS